MNAHTPTLAVTEYEPIAAALAGIEKYRGLIFEVTTPQGMKEAKAAHREVAAPRIALEKARTKLKADVLERGRLIDGEAKRIAARIAEIEEPLKSQIDAEERRIEEAREAAIRAEQERLAAEERARKEAEERQLAEARAKLAAFEAQLRAARETAEAEERARRAAFLAEQARQREAEEEARKLRQAEEDRIAAERRKVEEERMAWERAKLEKELAEKRAIEEAAAKKRAEAEAQAAAERAKVEAGQRAEHERKETPLSAERESDKHRGARIAEYREGFKEADELTRKWIDILEGDHVIIPPPEITRKQLLRVAKDFQTMYYAVVTHDEVVDGKNKLIDQLDAELKMFQSVSPASADMESDAFVLREIAECEALAEGQKEFLRRMAAQLSTPQSASLPSEPMR